MKKILLTVAAMASLTFAASAQTRMTIHEEFTGENCGPCAATNPGFWALCDTPGNLSKLIHITYMSPIPSSGWFYMQTQTLSDARISYYSVPFAPYGRYDGHVPDAGTANPGHPGYFHQTEIDSEAALPSPFTLSVTNAWNTTYDSVITTITIHCVTAWSGTTVKLRTALVQTLDFATSPGSNGETHFENVVRAMYPTNAGTSLAATWTAGSNQVITIRGAVPSYVDKSKSPYIVAWIQDDVSPNFPIAQAAKASSTLGAIPNDAAITASTGPTGLACHANGSYTVAHTVTLKNSGSNTLTSATINYQIDGGSMLTYSWSGSLAASATTSVTMPTATATISGPAYHTIYDSVSNPNGTADQNVNNNAANGFFFVESTNGLPMPYTTSFEGTDYMVHYASDIWLVYYNTTTPLGHTGSYAACYNYNATAPGVSNFYTLPEVTTASPCAIDFWVADCQIATTNTDKLEVVYSADCGSTWNSLWNLSGTSLATVPANSSTYFTPTMASQYVEHSVSLNSVPAGSIIAFRATSGGGQNLWLDDINVRAGYALNVSSITESSLGASIVPNPASNEAVLSFNLATASDVQVEIYDGVGRMVNAAANEKMDAGTHSVNINTSSFATGLYNVMIRTEGGVFTQRLSVVK